MSTNSFDFAQFVNFRPPRYLCPRCASIWHADDHVGWPDGWQFDYSADPNLWICGVCKLEFQARRQFGDLEPYLKHHGCALEFDEISLHFKALATVAKKLRSRSESSHFPVCALKNLLAAFNEARQFVHIVTWGLSWDFIGMLALLSDCVPV
jgi:hypothetical protein